MEKFTVYCHENIKNGKKYYGITSKSPDERWRNGEGYRNNEHFYRAIQKYGWSQFTHTVVYEVETEEEALLLEKSLILQNKTYMPNIGYNVLVGGNLNSEENKKILFLQKVKNGVIRKVVNIDTGEVFLGPLDAYKKTGIDASAICGVCIHKKNAHTAGGFRWCYEDEYQNYTTPISTRIVKKVINLDTNEVFQSLHDAERATGVLRKDISSVCKGERLTAGGFRWAFSEQPSENKREAKPLGKRVVNIDTGIIYDTIKKAAEATETTITSISKVCHGKGLTAAGYHWKFITDDASRYCGNKICDKETPKMIKRKVRNIELNVVYNSLKEAADSCGVSYTNISAVCRGIAKTSAGYHWEYVDSNEL